MERTVKAPTSPQREAKRAQVLLALEKGTPCNAVAEELGISRQMVHRWQIRFFREGLEGIKDRKGRGRKSTLPAEAIQKVLFGVSHPPPDGGVWSLRKMATYAGVSHGTVRKIWKAHEVKAHLTKNFKLSLDPEFETKFWDIVGLYIDPPEHALVLCCDEKSQCQALERTQPGLPLGIGHIRTRTHDYYRHGTVTLFAALDYLSGKVLAHTSKRHRHQEWLRFLKKIEEKVDAEKDIHIICDNYATHKHPKVNEWLKSHPRLTLHFTPTSSSWLNMVERFFAELTSQVIVRGSFRSVPALVADITRWIGQHNGNPRPYRWHADAQKTLEKIYRAWEALLTVCYSNYNTGH